MPSLQQFAGLWCSVFTAPLSALTGCSMDTITDDSGNAILAPALAPPGMQKCDYFDTREVALIAKALMYSLVTATVERGATDPFKPAAGKAGEVRKELLDYVNKASDDYSRKVIKPKEDDEMEPERPSEAVDRFLASFLGGKRSLFVQLSTKFALGDKKEDKVEQLLQELEKFGFWPIERRERLAKVLIERVDVVGTSHCGEVFPLADEDVLSDHQMQCRFAPYACANPGCGKVNSILHASEHDDVCPRKLIPCRMACSVEIPREEMDTHCLTVCAMKSVSCPFKSIGCEEPLRQGELLEHCQKLVEKHLYFTFLSHQQTAAASKNHEERITTAEQAVSMAQQTIDVDVRTLTQALRQAESRIKILEADMKKMAKDVKAANNSADVAHIKSELKVLKSSVNKAAAAPAPEHA